MEIKTLKTNIHCSSCVAKIGPALDAESLIVNWKVDLNHENKLVTLNGPDIDLDKAISIFDNAGYEAAEAAETHSNQHSQRSATTSFWGDKPIWKRASFNTLSCLIGCSIGDFGMLIYLQAYYPETSLSLQMVLAIIAGLTTSITLETVILRIREKFSWIAALKMAFSMSFISMIGMEVAMNATDFMITGGQAAFDTPAYWLALIPALIVGFLALLPYNYYKLKKFGATCL